MNNAIGSTVTDNHVHMAARFLTSAVNHQDAPGSEVAEVAFVGRSNAGKSSVLNRITGTHKLARISKTPGRTQMFNYFELDEGGRLVDLPGYGFARVSASTSATWRRRISAYLRHRTQLRGIVLVMDIRHPFRENDLSMIEECLRAGLPLLALLNKSDKLAKTHGLACLGRSREQFGSLGYPGDDVIRFSARTGEGAEAVRAWIRSHLECAP